MLRESESCRLLCHTERQVQLIFARVVSSPYTRHTHTHVLQGGLDGDRCAWYISTRSVIYAHPVVCGMTRTCHQLMRLVFALSRDHIKTDLPWITRNVYTILLPTSFRRCFIFYYYYLSFFFTHHACTHTYTHIHIYNIRTRYYALIDTYTTA